MNIEGIKSNKIVINGNQISCGSISIHDGEVLVDGKEVDNDEIFNMVGSGHWWLKPLFALTKRFIKIEINGDVGQVDVVSGDVFVSGSVGGDIIAMSGDVKAGNVYGSVSTLSGSIRHNNQTSPK